MCYTLRSALVYPAEGKKGDVDIVQCSIEWNWYSTLQTSTEAMVALGRGGKSQNPLWEAYFW